MTSKDASALLREEMSKLNFGGSDDQTDRLIIGLDFGTTYSGYVNVQSSPDWFYFDCHKSANWVLHFSESPMSLHRSLTKSTPSPTGLVRKEGSFQKPLQRSSIRTQIPFNGAMSSIEPWKRRLKASNCCSIPIKKSRSMFPKVTRKRSSRNWVNLQWTWLRIILGQFTNMQ